LPFIPSSLCRDATWVFGREGISLLLCAGVLCCDVTSPGRHLEWR